MDPLSAIHAPFAALSAMRALIQARETSAEPGANQRTLLAVHETADASARTRAAADDERRFPP